VRDKAEEAKQAEDQSQLDSLAEEADELKEQRRKLCVKSEEYDKADKQRKSEMEQ
jgi:hypothetical protein